MKVEDSGMPAIEYWESLFDVPFILKQMMLEKNAQTIAEFGTGYGTFTIPLAQYSNNKIFSYDIDPEMIQYTESKAAKRQLTNISFETRDLLDHGTGLASDSIDYCMLFNILHHSESEILLQEALRILQKGGQVGAIHWNFDPTTPRGPKMNIRPQPKELLSLIQTNGFFILENQIIDLPPFHYGIIGVKK